MGNPQSIRNVFAGAVSLAALTQGIAAAQEPGATEKDEIIVSASRSAQSIEQLGDAVSIIDAAAIELQQLTTLDEALERAPGVAITRSGGVGQNTQVRMRGFTSKHVLVMIDGVKINNPSEADNQFGIDHLFLDNVERVEVLRGPQSGVYGADAVAGVINVVTKRPEGPLELRGSGMYGSNDTYEVSAGAQGGNDLFGLSGLVSYYDTEGISLSSRAPGNVERDGYDNLTAQMRGELRPTENLELSAWVRYTDARNEIDAGYLAVDNPEGLPGYLFQDSDGYNDSEQIFAALKGVWSTFDGKLEHTAQVSLVDLNGLYVAPGSEQESEGRTIEGLYYATARPAEWATFIAGAEYRDERATFEQPVGYAYALIDDSIYNAAGFAEANIEVLDGVYLSGAVRYDYNEKFEGEFTYRVTAAYNLPDGFDLPGVDTKLRSSYGVGAEAPGLRQLLGSSATYQGNPDLQPESSWMVDFGIDQQLENGLAGWSVTYYVGEADDGIFNITDPVTFISSPQNVKSPVDMEGLELDFRFSPAPWIEARGAYTHMTVGLEGSGVQLFGRPKNEGSAAITFRPLPDISLTVDGYWRDAFFSDYPSSYVMPGYSVYSLSAVWEINDYLKLSANLHNIADKFYEEKLGDSTYGRTAQVRLTARY
ncbi:TonB-dependent receptor plug domain-containing protein [Hyphococcus luteus]|uniref:TonB-dependent receptor n=1 Tax=Hyphococcus luteus TaxID=2058213 RepID=A0A2S7K2N4_9PROT|nr:TonB-dependent receptor [Marinicaulis flavus]PQA86753.1 hypothetical protein CW354_14785 [Marinicaulis flavus]